MKLQYHIIFKSSPLWSHFQWGGRRVGWPTFEGNPPFLPSVATLSGGQSWPQSLWYSDPCITRALAVSASGQRTNILMRSEITVINYYLEVITLKHQVLVQDLVTKWKLSSRLCKPPNISRQVIILSLKQVYIFG